MPADVTLPNVKSNELPPPRALAIILASGLIDQPISVPWGDGLQLRLTTTSNGRTRP